MKPADTALTKISRVARELIVAWVNFGKEIPRADGMEKNKGEAHAGVIVLHEFIFSNDEPYVDSCSVCGEQKLMTAWIKLAARGIVRPCCKQCAFSKGQQALAAPEPLC